MYGRRPSYKQTTAPVLEPLEFDDVKVFLQEDTDEFDTQIRNHIQSARQYAEEYQWSQLITATWQLKLDRFPDVIELHPNPVSSVTTVAYVDTAGSAQTLTVTTDYTVDTDRHPGLIYPAYNKYWPDTRGYENDVTITFDAGYGSTHESVPETTKQAMLMLIKLWYDGCVVDEVPFSIRSLLDMHTYRVFV